MKRVKNILVILLGMIFLISSSGYVMYKTHCSCTNREQTSLFVKPETCETSFHKHHKHDAGNKEITCNANECHECATHTKSCGCDTPEVFFFKLKDKAIDDEVKFVATASVMKLNVATNDLLYDISETDSGIEVITPYTDSPHKITSSLDFLITIQQLKIPSLA